CAAQSLSLLVRTFSVPDVEQEALRVERFAGRVLDSGGVVSHPDDPPVTRDEAVLAPYRCSPAVVRPLECAQRSLAIVGMEEPREELRFRLPLGRRVAQHRLHLGTDV